MPLRILYLQKYTIVRLEMAEGNTFLLSSGRRAITKGGESEKEPAWHWEVAYAEYEDLQLIRLAISAYHMESLVHGMSSSTIYTLHTCTHSPNPPKYPLICLHTYKHSCSHTYTLTGSHRHTTHTHPHTYHTLTNSSTLKHKLTSTHTHAHFNAHLHPHTHCRDWRKAQSCLLFALACAAEPCALVLRPLL